MTKESVIFAFGVIRRNYMIGYTVGGAFGWCAYLCNLLFVKGFVFCDFAHFVLHLCTIRFPDHIVYSARSHY